ncbi:MAG TPA: hypothetical protein EYH45_05515 [Candidatus Caldiarchaeum subterraneum]|uniref:Aldehyde ferredoxin oxidoreductase N-terminal domain-containing protein n=1 Tax=Caldiarchaeum subterraneum TaxID=311458 RepID=A0A833ECP3_CALS0|nr:hypothetical protein [Aigarchaeota archaeon]HIQ30005.1 hypothetical protein [Candidatus Caldarchaeum subterraneum]
MTTYRLAFVDLSANNVDYITLSWDDVSGFIGGRGLGVALVYRNSASADALAGDNLLCVMTGPLTGSGFPMANRLTFIFISPMTNTIAWANTGGYAGAELRNAGVDGIVVKGVSERPCYLYVSRGVVEVRDASSLWGRGAVDAVMAFRHMHGDCRVLAIGPAGERLVKIATVVNDTGRSSGVRHGVGCVMGSKRLKAIVIRGSPRPEAKPADASRFIQRLKEAQSRIRASHLLNHENGLLAVYGTPIAVEALGSNDAIPVKNYRETTLPEYSRLGGRAMAEGVLINRMTCSYCPVSCRRETASSQAYSFRVEGPDYAQISSLGSNCMVMDLEAISYMNYLCYELGIDPIEAGNALAMLAEASELGYVEEGLRWGDVERMLGLLRAMALREEGLGEVLSYGACRAAEDLGCPELSMSVKGITIQNTDPRVEPAWGLLNAVESFGGAVHIWVYGQLIQSLAKLGVDVRIRDFNDAWEVASESYRKQVEVAVLDSLQVCAFSSYAIPLETLAGALEAMLGRKLDAGQLEYAGLSILEAEKLVNEVRGINWSSPLPRRFLEEEIPSGRHRGRVCELNPLLREYSGVAKHPTPPLEAIPKLL